MPTPVFNPKAWSFPALGLLVLCLPFAGCDVNSESPANGTSSQEVGQSTEPGTNNAKNGAQSSDKKADATGGEAQKPAEEPTFNIVGNAASGSGCILGENGNTRPIISNSKPNGPTDYAQWYFDAFQVDNASGKWGVDCTLELELKWTPGYRLRLQGTQLDTYSEHIPPDETRQDDKNPAGKDKALPGMNNGFWRTTTLGFSNRAPAVSKSEFASSIEGEGKVRAGQGQLSDCSGSGKWVAKMEIGVSEGSKSEFSLSNDAFSVLFEALEKCPEGES